MRFNLYIFEVHWHNHYRNYNIYAFVEIKIISEWRNRCLDTTDTICSDGKSGVRGGGLIKGAILMSCYCTCMSTTVWHPEWLSD